jgi:hypothetical protein
MTQLLDRNARKRPFARADILSHMGETICVVDVELPAPKRTPPPKPIAKVVDEDPERWDGLA